MSRTKDLVDYVVAAVADITEIPCRTIMSKCSRAEVVDARHIAVMLLHNAGLYSMVIADHMRITPRYVQYIVTDFADRIACNRLLRIKYEQTANKLRNDLEITAS